MSKTSIKQKLEENKAGLARLEERFNRGHGQEEGAYMAQELENLTNERDTLMRALSALRNHTQAHSNRLFTLTRTLSTAPKHPDSLEFQCVAIATTMTQGLAERCENGEITRDMYNEAHTAINDTLKFFTAKTTHEFTGQVTTAIEQVLEQTLSQATYG